MIKLEIKDVANAVSMGPIVDGDRPVEIRPGQYEVRLMFIQTRLYSQRRRWIKEDMGLYYLCSEICAFVFAYEKKSRFFFITQLIRNKTLKSYFITYQ